MASLWIGSGVDVTQRRLDQLGFPYQWSLVDWESRHIPEGVLLILAQLAPRDEGDLDARVQSFLTEAGASAGSPGGPLLLANAVAAGLKQSGAFAVGPFVLPPVTLAVGDAPRLLVVSPRGRIAFTHFVILDASTSMQAAASLERDVERLGVSAYVVEAIALGTYPVLIPRDTPAPAALQTVAHEWTHVALFPSPLALAYGSNMQARAINETTADLVGEEVRGRWQPERVERRERRAEEPPIVAELRRIRVRVDELLAGGSVDDAERFMEESRLELNASGYRFRRLNQAYFAFHGSYAEGPAASTEIPDTLRELRARSGSLAEFLGRVGRLTSVEDLRHAAAALN